MKKKKLKFPLSIFLDEQIKILWLLVSRFSVKTRWQIPTSGNFIPAFPPVQKFPRNISRKATAASRRDPFAGNSRVKTSGN